MAIKWITLTQLRNIEIIFIKIDSSKNPSQSLLELRDSIDTLAAIVLSQKGTLNGTVSKRGVGRRSKR